MKIEIIGTNMPGRTFEDHANVHVGVQKGKEPVDLVRADASGARWAFEVTLKEDGDLGGPYVHGKKGERFLYLSWNDVKPDGSTQMFRRAKLWLPAVEGEDLTGTLGLTDAKGGPRCASVRPPVIAWSWR